MASPARARNGLPSYCNESGPPRIFDQVRDGPERGLHGRLPGRIAGVVMYGTFSNAPMFRSDDRRRIERMQNAESEVRELIGHTQAVIAETESVIRKLDRMHHPVIDWKTLD